MANVPTIATTPRTNLKNRIGVSLALRAYEGAKMVFCSSNYTRQLILQTLKSEGKAIPEMVVLGHAVADEFIERPRNNSHMSVLKKELNLHGSKVLLTVSRLVEGKGIDVVIRALPYILGAGVDVKYLVAGEGPLRADLARLAQRQGVEERVIFLGKVVGDKLIDLYDLCDCFALVSSREEETFGIVLAEASARSKPVIAGNSGGQPDVVEDGKTGFLVDPHNVEDFAVKALKLLTDRQLAMQMGRLGKEKIVKAFSSAALAEKIRRALKRFGRWPNPV